MNVLAAQCRDCGHRWPAAKLPLRVEQVDLLAREIKCERCGNQHVTVVGPTGEQGIVYPKYN